MKLSATDDRPEGWHYAITYSNGGGPIGFCTEHPPHPSEIEARRCYTEYRRTLIELHKEFTPWTDCEFRGCENPTRQGASIKYEHRTIALCEEHHTIDAAYHHLSLYAPAGDSFGS